MQITLLELAPQGPKIHTAPDWRSWLNGLTKWQLPELHNHTPDTQQAYKYPLVQYAEWGIVGIEQGAGLLYQLIPQLQAQADLHIHIHTHLLQLSPRLQRYQLVRWLPFNTQNFQALRQQNFRDTEQTLNRILVNQLFAFASGVGYRIPNRQLVAHICMPTATKELAQLPTCTVDNLHFVEWNVAIETNLVLPEGIGLGKSVAKGFGKVKKIT